MAVDSRLFVNVALNRPAYQVNEYTSPWYPYTFPASNGNDGDNNTSQHGGGTCVATELATNPWWAVDLTVPLRVTGVKFTNRDESGISLRLYGVRH